MSPRPRASIPRRRAPHNFSRMGRVRKSTNYMIGSKKPRLVRTYIKYKQLGLKDLPNPPSDFHTDQNRLKNTVVRPSENTVDKKVKSEHPVEAEKFTSGSNPTSNTGITSTHSQLGYGYPLANPTTTAPVQILSSFLAVTTSSRRVFPTSFSALPPLASLPDGTNQSTPTATRGFSQLPTTTGGGQLQSVQPHQFDAAVIVLLAVGAALALLGGCIVIKICLQPRRQPRPIPSLPVLKEDAEHDFYETSEPDSPIFGGKERLSPMPGSAGPMWAWVQYPQPTAQQTTDDTAPDENASYSSDLPYHKQDSARMQTIPPQMAYNPSRQSTIRQAPPATSRTGNRLSSTSMYLYSPQTAYASIGLAISSLPEEAALTADGHDVIKRSKSRTLNKRKSQSGLDDRRRESANSCSELPYDEVETVPSTSNHGMESRARVKSGYFPSGTYPRASTAPNTAYSITTATKVKIGQRTSFIKGGHPVQRSNSKRLRDTQALTHALGLASPRTDYIVSPPPQESLYPDDSMSTAEVRQYKRMAPTIAQQLPPANDNDSKTLMAMEFGVSQMSLGGLARDGDDHSSSGNPEGMEYTVASSLSPLRNTDKPPRVPSPPPLLSLTQMGLAHNNPEGYASYRSPTYSIYGLYEADGKSSLGHRG